MTSDQNIQALVDERSRLMKENRKLKAIIRSALAALDNGFLISSQDLALMRQVTK